MKIKSGYVLRNIAGQYMAVPVGSRVKDLHGYFALNDTGAYLWNLLSKECSLDQLALSLVSEYNISYEDATIAVNDFKNLLSSENLLDEVHNET